MNIAGAAGIESSRESVNQYYPQVSEPQPVQETHREVSTLPKGDFDTGTKTICSRTCTVSEGRIESKEKYRDVVVSLAKLQSLSDIDDYSAENMALALEYVNVDTLEKAVSLDLRIIPPGPVFYTWAAIHKSAIFDTENNPKEYLGLNYVAKIKENANRLAKKQIPVMVVFSECEMSGDQIAKMKEAFVDNENIIVLSVEMDLKDCLESSSEIFEYQYAHEFLDTIRIAVIRDADNVLSAALKLAEKEKKDIARIGLMKKAESICYTDIDNEFLEQSPDYVLSRNGLYSFPRFVGRFSFLFIKAESLARLPADEAQRVKKHQNYFTGHPYLDGKTPGVIWDNEKRRNSFSYIFSGKARSEFIELLRIVSKVENVSYVEPECDIWDGDNGLISVKNDAVDIFKERVTLGSTFVNFFENPEESVIGNVDPFYSIAHSLVGIQLWRTFLGGHDLTW